MKKINFLFVAFLVTFNLNAQELIPNGGFENWNDNIPINWGVSFPAGGGSVYQSSIRYLGNYSAEIDAPEGSGFVRLYLEEDLNIVPGQQYIFSYWYDDSFGGAKFRHWASFRDINGVEINSHLDQLQPDYLPDTEGWEEIIIVVTAPVNAAKFRLDFRIYEDNPNLSDEIYIDGVSFKAENMSISDLENPKVSINSVWNSTANFNAKGNATVEIFNLNGQLVQKGNGSNNFELNVASLTKGVYVVKITVDGVATTQKVVKK